MQRTRIGKNQVKIIRVDGREELHTLSGTWQSYKEIEKLIDSTVFDTVSFGNGQVMLVDDEGYIKQKGINPKATMLYWEIRGNYNWHIVGDVAIVNDEDFE